ncbi:MAG: 3-hydroxybutyryl-CoA dehydrogenase [Chloroflexi bacterium]|nr:3-hydroxybutyryl-CoA dehydrogenase [Chloroflexota bacterium]
MGAGIAQVCALRDFETILYDISDEIVSAALEKIQASIRKGVELGKTPAGEADSALARLRTATRLSDLAPADLIIEAVPEKLDLKQHLFHQLDFILAPSALLASNTSSLSITAIAGATKRPSQVLGLHFFNPPLLMALVEVVRGDQTSDKTLNAGMEFARALGKTPVVCSDTPAFIVNRVARPFYGESLRLLGEHAADAPTIDKLMKSLGFRMGPFELIDLIGLDVNFAVTQSVYNAFFHDPKYRPHPIQQKMVDAGLLGRKTKRGFYEYP